MAGMQVTTPWWDGDVANWVVAICEIMLYILVPTAIGAGNAYYWMFFSARHPMAKITLGVLVASASLLISVSSATGILEVYEWINQRIVVGSWPPGNPR